MDLPAELRELIYYYASAPFPPIDTASIRNTPDTIRCPVIAQLSRQTRNEALAVFYRSREVHLSLHCQRNIERSIAWLTHWGDDVQLTDNIIFAGLHKPAPPGSMFHLTLTRLHKDKDIQYRVEMRPHEDAKAEMACKVLGEAVLGYINEKIEEDRRMLGEVGKLTKSELRDIFNLVKQLTGWEVPVLQPPQGWRSTPPPGQTTQKNRPLRQSLAGCWIAMIVVAGVTDDSGDTRFQVWHKRPMSVHTRSEIEPKYQFTTAQRCEVVF